MHDVVLGLVLDAPPCRQLRAFCFHSMKAPANSAPCARARASPRACFWVLGKALLPAGMVLWAWDADPEFGEVAGERWLALLPKKWKKQQVYGWRYDPREFVAGAAPTRDERRHNAMRAEE